jgi:N-acetylglucosaminyl-diphospho-decaprenol L-rhamnosyltransferase
MMTLDGGSQSLSDTRQAKLSVVIVTFNSAIALPPLLNSISAGMNGIGEYEVVVVDNLSNDGSADLAESHPIRPKVIRMGRNAGYAAAINAATAVVDQNSAVLILNPDLRLYPSAAAALMKQLSVMSVGVVVPTNYTEDGEIDLTLRREPSIATAWADALLGGRLAGLLGWGETITKQRRYGRSGLVDWATGSALLISAEARHAAGGWDESFFLYSEEVDYLRRVREAGFGVLYEPESQVMHAGGGSGRNPKLFALQTVNRIRYYASNHGRVPTFVFRLGVVIGEALRCWRNPSHRAALSNSVKPLVKGADFMIHRS